MVQENSKKTQWLRIYIVKETCHANSSQKKKRVAILISDKSTSQSTESH